VIRYFAYGSNLVVERMRERGADFAAARPATLRDHRLTFDKRSRDGSGRANVARSAGGRVYGVLYDLSRDALEHLKQFECGYDLVEVVVEAARSDGRPEAVPARMFVARTDRRTDAPPSRSYVELILKGLEDHGLPDAARDEVRRAAKVKPAPIAPATRSTDPRT
jgi:cation transport regulator ChaC